MVECRVCGREFDPGRFQVVVPGLGQGFDRVECAEQARTLLGPAAALPPLTAVVHPSPAAAPAALAAAAPLVAAAADGRRPLLVGANLALLAAGTAATVFLWFRVFGADPAAFELSDPGLAAAPAFERSTIPAQISSRTPSRSRSDAAAEARRVSSTPRTAATDQQNEGESLVAVREPAPPSSPGRGPSAGDGAAVGGGSGGGSDGGSGGGQPKPPPAPSDDDEGTSGGGGAGGGGGGEDEPGEDDDEREGGEDDDEDGDDDGDEDEDEDEDRSSSESARSQAKGHHNDHERAHSSGHGKKAGHKDHD